MNKYYLYGAGALILLAGIFFVSQSGSSSRSYPTATATHTTRTQNPASAPAATSSVAIAPAATTPQDIVPGLYPNPIKNTATALGIKITSVMVENNTDTAGNAVSDHLQITLQNLTGKTLSNLEAYYTIVDTATGKKEGYYKQLTGFTLAPHGTGTVHFDGQSGYGHYAANMRGIYGTTTDQLKFTLEVSVSGYAPVSANATKAPGGAEVVGQ